MNDLTKLKRAVSSRWAYTLFVWTHRKTISALCEEREKHDRHVATLWKFIVLRHRLDMPTVDGSIKQLLEQAQPK